MKIRTKLTMNAIIATSCLILVGVVSFFYIHHLAGMSKKLVDEHAEIIIQTAELEKISWEIWSRLIIHTSTYDVEAMNTLDKELKQFQQQLGQKIHTIEQIYAGLKLKSPEDLVQFNHHWKDFYGQASEALNMSKDFVKEDSLTLLVNSGHEIFHTALNYLQKLENHHRKNMLHLRDNAEQDRQEAAWVVGLTTVFVGFGILIILLMVSRSITRPLNAALDTARQIAQGHLTARTQHHITRDEIGTLLSEMNRMANNLQSTIHELSQVFGRFSQGEMAARIETDFLGDFAQLKQATNEMGDELQEIIHETSRVLGHLSQGEMQIHVQREFIGDFKEIKNSLDHAARKLGDATTENTRQNWLKTGQSQLSEQSSGDKTLLNLAEDIINFLVPYLDAQVGAFYLLQPSAEDEHKTVLKMMATHAYVWRSTHKHEFSIGESLVGQAAMERKTFVLESPPENYLRIQSGLGESVPRMILVAPFLYENEVKGVIELASIQPFTDKQLEFLKQVLPTIGIAINTAESRHRMKNLLEKSEAQSSVLRTQKEQMQAQQLELQESNETLQSQSEELQSQSEELQVQQEELRQTNETLEERTRDLERQQASVEQKNRELEKAKMAIQTKADELELTSKYKSEFLANMSHELRTPLNSLLILAQMLANNKKGHLDEKETEQAQTIHNAGADLLTLINDILDLSKVEAGKVQLHIEQFALTQLLDNTRQRFEPIAERQQLAFHIRVTEQIPKYLTTDIQRVQQVLTNLFSNAFKFTQKGAVTLDIYRPTQDELQELVGLNLDATHSIAFNVTDSGIGIPKHKAQVIFEAFQQADGTTSRRFGGTGLGLSISRQLARLLGGDIRLRSVENEGSSFILYVPEKLETIEQSSAEKQHHFAAPPPQMPTAKTNKTTPTESKKPSVLVDDREHLKPEHKSILMIDDDPQFAEILLQAGHDEGYQCLLAENGRDGLSMAEQYMPNAIMLDIGLPLVDGLTVIDRLKQNLTTRHIPIHVISAGEHGRTVKQMGALGYYLKPVNMEQLHEAFAKFRHILEQDMRHLLLMSDRPEHADKIKHWLDNKDVSIVVADTVSKALAVLKTRHFDCSVLDMDAQEALPFLQHLRDHQEDAQVPLIFYAERELTQKESQYLNEWHGDAVLKAVYSPERLVDEVSLFLHQIEAKLPEEKRHMLRLVHDKEAVLKNRKVLLVDDDIRNVYALSAVLEEKDMQVIAAENGKQALILLEKQADVDIVLMDIMMPEMDGYETMRNIRAQEHWRKLPIIALTAKAMKDDRSKCLEAGANDYLPKPVNSEQLISLLRVWLYQ